jgi:hypothetical protein
VYLGRQKPRSKSKEFECLPLPRRLSGCGANHESYIAPRRHRLEAKRAGALNDTIPTGRTADWLPIMCNNATLY